MSESALELIEKEIQTRQLLESADNGNLTGDERVQLLQSITDRLILAVHDDPKGALRNASALNRLIELVQSAGQQVIHTSATDEQVERICRKVLASI